MDKRLSNHRNLTSLNPLKLEEITVRDVIDADGDGKSP